MAALVSFHDCTHFARRGNKWPDTRVRRGKTVMRCPSTITGMGIHQTATPLPIGPWWLKQAGGQEELAKRLRCTQVASQFVGRRDGQLVLSRPILAYTYHGNGLNGTTVGVEFEGAYSGLLDDPKTTPREDILTFWKKKEPMELDDETVEVFRRQLSMSVMLSREAGCNIRFIYAHRQSSWTRRSDPGEGIWKWVVMDYGVKVLGLEAVPNRVWGKGRPIPVEWDRAHGVGRY